VEGRLGREYVLYYCLGVERRWKRWRTWENGKGGKDGEDGEGERAV